MGIRPRGGKKVPGLRFAGSTQREEVIDPALDPGIRDTDPVGGKGPVDPVTTLRGLEVGEGDPVPSNGIPVDHPLMMGHINPEPLPRLKGRPPVRKKEIPKPRGKTNQQEQNRSK